MYPHERSLVKNLSGKKFALIGINSDDDPAVPQGLAKDGVVNWRSFWNGPDALARRIATARRQMLDLEDPMLADDDEIMEEEAD